MVVPNDEFFASLERNFIGTGCTMKAQTTVSYSTQCGLFISEYKKYTVSGVTSFKVQLFINEPISGGGGRVLSQTSKHRTCTN